eukprot:XP_025014947.1 uncharacterized protein At2g29880-like [Ricinus communis]
MILPALNKNIGCNKNYSQYLSHLKWFKQKYNNDYNILRYNSRFGWNLAIKKFTPPNVTFFADYEDLRIVIENGTAIGKNTIRLGEDIEAITLNKDENRGYALDELIYDTYTEIFRQKDI